MPDLVAELRVQEIVCLETLVHRRWKLESIGIGLVSRCGRILVSDSAAATSFVDVARGADRVLLIRYAVIVLVVSV